MSGGAKREIARCHDASRSAYYRQVPRRWADRRACDRAIIGSPELLRAQIVCVVRYKVLVELPMIENDKIAYGNFDDAFPMVKRRLNGFLASYDRIKIGATTNPDTRWRRGYAGNDWAKMVILYESKWAGSTRKMERELIEYARTTNFRVRPENILPGGEMIEDGARQYFVYIVVG